MPTRRKASFGATVRAVFWSFFGVRKKSDYEKDAAQLNPVHVVIAGVIGVLIFIATLVTIVHFVVAK
jgi:preprotein translocase subunit Sec61beta